MLFGFLPVLQKLTILQSAFSFFIARPKNKKRNHIGKFISYFYRHVRVKGNVRDEVKGIIFVSNTILTKFEQNSKHHAQFSSFKRQKVPPNLNATSYPNRGLGVGKSSIVPGSIVGPSVYQYCAYFFII
jgi:hypothetical protein